MWEINLSTSRGMAPTKWSKLKSTGPAPRSVAGMATVGTNVYLLGGLVGSAQAADVWALDTITETWTQKASAPVAVQNPAVCSVGKKIYLLGGFIGSGPNKQFYSYDTVANTWTTLTAPPAVTSRGVQGATMINVGADLFLIGGYYDTAANLETLVYKYVVSTATWTAVAVHPFAIAYAAAAVVDDTIIVAHGHAPKGVANRAITAYNPYTNAWTTKIADNGSTVAARIAGPASVINNIVYYHGGATTLVESYNLLTNTYSLNAGTQDQADAAGWQVATCRNRQYFFGSASNFATKYDNYAGEQPPAFVIIPHQEFLSASEFSTLLGFTAGTVRYEGLNWMLFRDAGVVKIIPQKPIRVGVTKDEGQRTGTINTNGMTLRLDRPTVFSATSDWDNLFVLVTTGTTIPTGKTRLASLSPATEGFSPSSYAWTATPNGAYEQICRGGSSYGGQASLHGTADRADYRPILTLTAGTSPW